MMDKENLLYLNGLDAVTGRPFIEPIPYNKLTQRIFDLYKPEQLRAEQEKYSLERFALFKEYKLEDPGLAGWGLLVHADEADAMKERLAPLIEHRNGRILIYSGESVYEWKAKNHADAVNPNRFPYYVMIAGSPSKIPYELQFSLDVLQAVGRIEFDDPLEYERYAQNVVNQEKGELPSPGKQVVFFAPRHPGDYPTNQSSQRLVRPILKDLPQSDVPSDLSYIDLIGDSATKMNLINALSPDKYGKTPALLFSASHGAGVRTSDINQRALQGSIICQDYTVPLTPQQRQGFITGHDVAEGFCLPGGIYFLFACYGAGTRKDSDFINYLPDKESQQQLKATQGNEDFVAYLPKKLLAHPHGGALAVVGHVDPAWIHSFTSPVTKERRIYPFGLTLARLLRGNPVGFAVATFNQKYSDLSVDLLSIIEDIEDTGQLPDSSEFMDLWVCRNDAQNYVIIGDPAVRLSFE